MKKIFLFLAIFVSSIQEFSQDAVTISSINLRESTSSSSKSLLIIPKGVSISIQECANGWCKTNYNDLSGYGSSKLIHYTSEISNDNTTNSSQVHGKVKHYTNSSGERIQSPTHYASAPEGATAICRDGTYSFSRNRRGTCSHHGGVKKWL